MLQMHRDGLYQMLRAFHTLTNTRIVLFDENFRELLAYPERREGFCTLLRQTEAGEIACRESDKNGCRQCAQCKKPVIYRCHAGLTEVVVPVTDNVGVLAYVMFGQILSEDRCEHTKHELRRHYPNFASEVDLLPMKTQQELEAAAAVVQTITAYVMTNHWLTPGKSEFIRQLDRYIEEHLHESIPVEDLCAVFRIGRTTLYEISLDYLGCGPAEHIRKQRILHARRMLTETDRSVTDIAFAVGFSDYNHFSRTFRQMTGVSAREYRKNSK